MTRFVDRKEELATLGHLASQNRPHFLTVFGRRRLGKTTLLLEFATRSGMPTLYWVASKQSAPVLQRSLYNQYLSIPGRDHPKKVRKPIGVYAIFGRVPAYLERIVPERSIRANVEQETMAATGIFRTEAFHSLQEDLRDTHSYHSILQAIGQGHRTHDEIALHSGVARTSLSRYLNRLMVLGYIERRLPATVPMGQRGRSRQSRYALADQFLRFFYRFISPNLVSVE